MIEAILKTSISVSRISDHVHHPIDVLAGIVFGLQTFRAFHKSEEKLTKMTQEGRQHLASVRSEVAADISPNGQVQTRSNLSERESTSLDMFKTHRHQSKQIVYWSELHSLSTFTQKYDSANGPNNKQLGPGLNFSKIG